MLFKYFLASFFVNITHSGLTACEYNKVRRMEPSAEHTHAQLDYFVTWCLEKKRKIVFKKQLE